MKLPLDREMLTQVAVVVGVCLGGWMVLVQPRVQELSELEAANEARRQFAASFKAMPTELVADQTDRLNVLCDDIEARSRLSADTAQLFGLIMALAAEQHVEVRNLQPRVESVPGSKTMSITKIDMSADGDYAALTGFLSALQHLRANVRTWSAQITPASDKDKRIASMQLGCETLSFTLPEVVQKLRRKTGDE